ncbi:flagellin [Sulfuriferula sp. AH1]|uniref:flagellin n=1 Tax=Sulfuriferula sp. AH1 TaxID=1985873 RepID=UPI000B3B2752|nr:flagellin [Sulfuriferula sp. AH1]ARU31496.1 flagellin [Sulfuriferula sp. AH1]
MAQVINTNVAALFAGAALNRSNLALQTAQQRLSSGLRINSAKDDPTGLITATNYDSQIRGANQAIRNANDGISKAQTNDGYLSQITENLQRLREIAVQNGGSASGVEASALVTENTRLNGLVNSATTTVVNSADGGTFTTTGVKPTLSSTGTSTVAQIDTDITAVSNARANYGADMASLSSAVANLQTYSVNTSASYSRVMDTDYAAESANMAKNNILQQAGTAVLAQANQTPNTVLTLLR